MTKEKCVVINDGLAIGIAKKGFSVDTVEKRNDCDIFKEKEKFDLAISKSIEDLNQLKRMVMLDSTVQYEFLDAHILLLSDPCLEKEIIAYLEENKCNIEYAFQTIIDKYINEIANAEDTYLKERSLDISDIKTRVLKNLHDIVDEDAIKEDTILFVDELYPSLLININTNIKGIVAKRGGFTSHSAILSRALNLCYVISDAVAETGEQVIIDTKTSSVIVDPDQFTITEYEYMDLNLDIDSGVGNVNKGPYTIMANISSNQEIPRVYSNYLDGIGLYRSEFLFIAKGRMLDLEEQQAIYEEVSSKLYPKPVVIRTFDMGEDKTLSYLDVHKKGAYNYFTHEDLFEIQVRAICRANKQENLRIMFPMIYEPGEYTTLKKTVLRIAKEEKTEIPIGMMLETAWALSKITEFEDVDFISIGTNDLMCDLYKLNRMEAEEYEPHIDDLISRLVPVVEFSEEKDIPLSICGEIAAKEDCFKKLVRIGMKTFSINIPNAKNVLRIISQMVERKR